MKELKNLGNNGQFFFGGNEYSYMIFLFNDLLIKVYSSILQSRDFQKREIQKKIYINDTIPVKTTHIICEPGFKGEKHIHHQSDFQHVGAC